VTVGCVNAHSTSRERAVRSSLALRPAAGLDSRVMYPRDVRWRRRSNVRAGHEGGAEQRISLGSEIRIDLFAYPELFVDGRVAPSSVAPAQHECFRHTSPTSRPLPTL